MYTYIITKTVIEVKLIQNITKITLPGMCIRYVKKRSILISCWLVEHIAYFLRHIESFN